MHGTNVPDYKKKQEKRKKTPWLLEYAWYMNTGTCNNRLES